MNNNQKAQNKHPMRHMRLDSFEIVDDEYSCLYRLQSWISGPAHTSDLKDYFYTMMIDILRSALSEVKPLPSPYFVPTLDSDEVINLCDAITSAIEFQDEDLPKILKQTESNNQTNSQAISFIKALCSSRLSTHYVVVNDEYGNCCNGIEWRVSFTSQTAIPKSEAKHLRHVECPDTLSSRLKSFFSGHDAVEPTSQLDAESAYLQETEWIKHLIFWEMTFVRVLDHEDTVSINIYYNGCVPLKNGLEDLDMPAALSPRLNDGMFHRLAEIQQGKYVKNVGSMVVCMEDAKNFAEFLQQAANISDFENEETIKEIANIRFQTGDTEMQDALNQQEATPSKPSKKTKLPDYASKRYDEDEVEGL